MRKLYSGSIALGLNDALVEITGALAGFTFALQESMLIGILGLIMGVAAALSMAASEFLSSKEEKSQNSRKEPLKGAVYTGISYIISVALLVLPFFLFSSVYVALTSTLIIALVIIGFFNKFISVEKNVPFWKRFFTMAVISLSVAFISFLFGLLLRNFVGM